MPFFEGSFYMANDNQEILNPRQNNKTNRERREKEEQQTKWLRLGGMIVGGIVVVCMIVGLILGIFNKPSRKVVAKVGDEKITLEDFQSAVRLQRSNINSNYQYMEQLYSMFGMQMDESTREEYAMQMSDAYKGLLGQSVLSNMVDQRVLAYGAAKEGITVSDDEVENYYKSMFAYYPDGTPTAAPTDAPFEATPTVSEEQLAILRYTETPLPTDIPAEEVEAIAEEVDSAVEEAVEEIGPEVEEAVEEAEAEIEETVDEVEATVEEANEAVEETVEELSDAVEYADTVEEAVENVNAVVEEAESEVKEAVEEAAEETAAEIEEAVDEAAAEAEDLAAETADLVNEALQPTVTPTVYTEDMFKQYESVYFANNYYYSKDFFKGQLKYELLQNKVEEKLKSGIERTADMVWARHILVATEEEAKAALERIKNGEEWGDVAAEVSTDTSNASNAGDLGWFTQGTMVQAFNDAAFSQEVGTISEPVQTDFGWHLIQVIAHEEHPYTSSEYKTAVDNAYREWLNGYSEQLDITMENNVADMTPTDPSFVG